MDREILRRLEMLNHISLTDSQKEDVLAFFDKREKDLEVLNNIDTSAVERMVHVMPVMTTIREDVVSQPFTREALQSGAPESDEGYWCVPKVVE